MGKITFRDVWGTAMAVLGFAVFVGFVTVQLAGW